MDIYKCPDLKIGPDFLQIGVFFTSLQNALNRYFRYFYFTASFFVNIRSF